MNKDLPNSNNSDYIDLFNDIQVLCQEIDQYYDSNKELLEKVEQAKQHNDQKNPFLEVYSIFSQANCHYRSKLFRYCLNLLHYSLKTTELCPENQVALDNLVSQTIQLSKGHEQSRPIYLTSHLPPFNYSSLIDSLSDISSSSSSSMGSSQWKEFIIESLKDINDISISEATTSSTPVAKGSPSSPTLHKHFNDYTESVGFYYGFDETMTSYPFNNPDIPEYIIMDDEHIGSEKIKYIALDKLIEKMSDNNWNDNLELRYVVLLTFHSFIDAPSLLDKLIQRFHVPLPPNLTPQEIQYYHREVIHPIQLKVISVMKYWIENHWDDYLSDPCLLEKLSDWLSFLSSMPLLQIKKGISDLQKFIGNHIEGRQPRMTVANPSKPLFTCTSKSSFNFLECNELEIARQLTIYDWNFFKNILPRECVNKIWTKDKNLAPNIIKIADRFNSISLWTQKEILVIDINNRKKILQKFISIAEHCLSLNNFNSLYAIYCGINSNSIHRLHKTWNIVNVQSQQKYQEFAVLFNPIPNFQNLRNRMQESVPPIVPYLGLFLCDLTFIEDGNKSKDNNLINYIKLQKLADRILWIKQFQQVPYLITDVHILQEYLSENLENINQKIDEDILWNLSSKIEPKS